MRRCRWIALATLLLTASATVGETVVIEEGGITVELDGVPPEMENELTDILREQLQFAGGSAARAPLADDLAFFTEQFLIREGKPKATTRWELKPEAIHLLADTGPSIRIGTITWEGETPVETEELTDYLLRPTKELTKEFGEDQPWVGPSLDGGAALVKRRLAAEGYLLAEVELEPGPEPTVAGEDGDLLRDLTVRVNPGPVTTFGDVVIRGDPLEAGDRINRTLADLSGSPFNEAKLQDLENRLRNGTVAHGFLSAEVTSAFTPRPDGGAVDVEFDMVPGPRTRIVGVEPHPDFDRGTTRVLDANFKPAIGRFYSETELDDLFGETLQSGLFTRLEYETVPQGEPVDGVIESVLVLEGEEVRPHTLGFQLGYDTFLGAQVGMTYRNANIFDSGNSFSTELLWSPAGPLASAKITDPAVLGTRHTGTIQLTPEWFELYDYRRFTFGLDIELARRLTKHISYTVFLSGSRSSSESDVLTAAELGPDEYALSGLGGSLQLDFRDSPVIPTKGWMATARVEQNVDAQDTDLQFLRTDLRAALYQPLTKKFRVMVGATLQSLTGVESAEVPIDSRVFNGGPNSMRAFAERELGPFSAEGDTPLGGTNSFFATTELSYEIVKNFDFALFYDVGSLGTGEISSPFEFSTDLRHGVGVGLRYRLPFGPIRIDYGYNLDRREDEDTGALHITVGFSF